MSTMSTPLVEVSRKDIAGVMAQLNRAQREVGLSAPRSMNLAMRAVLNSLATSTKVSKEFRDYRQVGESRSGKNKVYEVTTRYATPARKGKALRRSWTSGPWRGQLIYAENEDALKKRPAVIIAMRGLAAETFRQAGRKGGFHIPKKAQADSRAGRNMRIMMKAARRWAEYESHLKGDDPWLKMTNTLDYAQDALSGGASSVNTAMERAARALEHTLDNMMAKKYGAK